MHYYSKMHYTTGNEGPFITHKIVFERWKALDEELERDVIQPNPSYALRTLTPPPELSDDDAEPEKPQQQMVGIPARAMQMSYR